MEQVHPAWKVATVVLIAGIAYQAWWWIKKCPNVLTKAP
jgi:hypothetical protein